MTKAEYKAFVRKLPRWERAYVTAAYLPFRFPFKTLKLWFAKKAGYIT